MRIYDFIILALCCLFWGANFSISKWMLTDLNLPPFFFACARFSVVAILMAPFLFPLPKKFFLLAMAALSVGAVHLGVLYVGLQTAPASSAAIVSQLLVPFATILSVVFLKEVIGWRRALGIIGALIGVVVLIYDPQNFGLDFGLIFVVLAYLAMAAGSIFIKGVGDVSPWQYLAWMGWLAVFILGAASFLFEENQFALAQQAGWKMGVGVAYTAILTSIFAHGQYYRILQKYDVTLVVPLTLMTPFFGVIIGVVFRGEPIGPKFYLGAILVLLSVYVLAKRGKKPASVIETPHVT